VVFGTRQIILITNNSTAPITPAIELENARLRDTDVFIMERFMIVSSLTPTRIRGIYPLPPPLLYPDKVEQLS